MLSLSQSVMGQNSIQGWGPHFGVCIALSHHQWVPEGPALKWGSGLQTLTSLQPLTKVLNSLFLKYSFSGPQVDPQ